jgi:hypothetical protein
MTTEVRVERVQELGESAYLMLKESYHILQELKGMVDRLHAGCLQQGKTMDFDTVSAIKLTTDRLYADLERYIRPECDPDSAYDDAMPELPKV